MKWFDQAKCQGGDIDVFFPEVTTDNGSGKVWEPARLVCAVCPVKTQCLEFVLPFEATTGRRNGMWGGMTPRERDQHVYYLERVKP